MAEKITGTVIRVIPPKGFGFVRGDDDITRFVHVRDFVNPRDFERLREGMGVKFVSVEFNDTKQKKGNGLRGVEVELIT
jgi:cold shock CspA family protein